MCNMADNSARTVPLECVLILSICLASLLVHVCIENLGPAYSFALEWMEDGGRNAASDTTGEDPFILPEFSVLEVPIRSNRVDSPQWFDFASFTPLPLLPPPIAF